MGDEKEPKGKEVLPECNLLPKTVHILCLQPHGSRTWSLTYSQSFASTYIQLYSTFLLFAALFFLKTYLTFSRKRKWIFQSDLKKTLVGYALLLSLGYLSLMTICAEYWTSYRKNYWMQLNKLWLVLSSLRYFMPIWVKSEQPSLSIMLR